MLDELDCSAYRVQLDTFSGPMDLLLFLVRREEVAISDLPISRITDQYLAYIENLEDYDLSVAGDFLILAATLMEIKSRLLLPLDEQPASEEEEIDPGSELIQRLMEYKRFKDAARTLQTHGEQREKMFSRPETVVQIPQDWIDEEILKQDPLEGMTLWDLLNAYTRVACRARVVDEAKVTNEELPLRVFFDQIATLLKEKSPRRFDELFTDFKDRGQVIGTFLAMLELVRLKKIKVVQTEEFGPIWVEWIPGASLSEAEVDEAATLMLTPPEERPVFDDDPAIRRAPAVETPQAAPGPVTTEETTSESPEPAADHVHIETLRSRAVRQHEESLTALPGFLPSEETPIPLSRHSLGDGGCPRPVDPAEELIEEFQEEDEIDHALAEVVIPEIDKLSPLPPRDESTDPAPGVDPS